MGKLDETPASFLFGTESKKKATPKATPKPTPKRTTKKQAEEKEITLTAPEWESEEDMEKVWKNLPIKKKEKRDRRVQLVLTPSLYEWLKAKTKKEGSTVNDYINRLLETIRETETTPKRRRTK